MERFRYLENKGSLIVVFDSTHQVLLGEKVLKQAKVKAEVIPLPKKFRADCGLALKINGGLKSLVAKILLESQVQHKGIYFLK